jgi:hypothetical protein
VIEALKQFEPSVAAGILARAALSLDTDLHNPAANFVLQGEDKLREKIILEFSTKLGIPPIDSSYKTAHLISSEIDRAIDEIIGSIKEKDALERISARGEFPSDEFEIVLMPNIKDDIYQNHFKDEYPRIIETIKRPHKELQFGQTESLRPLVSLFGRFYRSKFPARDFLLLIVGQRKGLVLEVHNVWRVYPYIVPIREQDDLVTILKNFTNTYGTKVISGKAEGNFIHDSDLPAETKQTRVSIPVPKNPNHTFTVTQFLQHDSSGKYIKSSLTVSIDLTEYLETIKKYGWDIIAPK